MAYGKSDRSLPAIRDNSRLISALWGFSEAFAGENVMVSVRSAQFVYGNSDRNSPPIPGNSGLVSAIPGFSEAFAGEHVMVFGTFCASRGWHFGPQFARKPRQCGPDFGNSGVLRGIRRRKRGGGVSTFCAQFVDGNSDRNSPAIRGNSGLISAIRRFSEAFTGESVWDAADSAQFVTRELHYYNNKEGHWTEAEARERERCGGSERDAVGAVGPARVPEPAILEFYKARFWAVACGLESMPGRGEHTRLLADVA